MPLEKGVPIDEYAKKTDSWTGADIAALCREAGVITIKRAYITKDEKNFVITKNDFDTAFKNLAKTLGKSVEEKKK